MLLLHLSLATKGGEQGQSARGRDLGGVRTRRMHRSGQLHHQQAQRHSERCRHRRESIPALNARDRVVAVFGSSGEPAREGEELRNDGADDGAQDVSADEVARLAERAFGDGVEEDGGGAKGTDGEGREGKGIAWDGREAGRDGRGNEDRREGAEKGNEIAFGLRRKMAQRTEKRSWKGAARGDPSASAAGHARYRRTGDLECQQSVAQA